MTKFKYSLNIYSENRETLNTFLKEIEKTGYTCSWREEEGGVLVLGNAGGSDYYNGKAAVITGKVLKRDYEFNIDNKWEYEAALAIAAIRDDNNPHIGEWVICPKEVKSRTSYGVITSLAYNGEAIRRIDNINGKSFGFGKEALITDLDYNRKATPEEIIQYMKQKYQIPILPEKWAIHDDEIEDKKDFQDWYQKQIGSSMRWDNNDCYSHFPRVKGLGFYYSSIQKGYTKINYHQWKEWFDYQQQSNKNQQVMELPKNWCIRGGEELAGFIEEQEIKLGVDTRISGEHDDQYYWLNSPENFASWSWWEDIPSNRELVSFKQFEEWYNQQTMNKNKDKKIIGYKLIKSIRAALK